MRIKVDEYEQYPAAMVWLPGDEGYDDHLHSGRHFDLTEAEAEHLRQARDAWRAWERRLLDMLDPPEAAQGTPESMGLL